MNNRTRFYCYLAESIVVKILMLAIFGKAVQINTSDYRSGDEEGGSSCGATSA